MKFIMNLFKAKSYTAHMATEMPWDAYKKMGEIGKIHFNTKKELKDHLASHPELHGHKIEIRTHSGMKKYAQGSSMIGGIASYGTNKEIGSEEHTVKPPKLEKSMKKSRLFNQADVDFESWNEFFREGGELNTPGGQDMAKWHELKELYKKVANFQNKIIQKNA